MRSLKGLAALAAVWLLPSACTMVGVHDLEAMTAVEFGPSETIRFCVLHAPDVPEEKARRLMTAVGREFDRYRLDVEVPWVKPWVRPGFTVTAMLEDIVPRPIEPPCDRLVAMVGRHLGDALWGFVLPEVLGAVETVTHTKGYVVANMASLGQIGLSPAQGAVHESYHFLGCGHALGMGKCYLRIAEIKKMARANRAAGRDFFPGLTGDGQPITTRRQVHTVLRRVLELRPDPAPGS